MLKFDVDSEVFELTTAMLKQKSEREYQSLIELLFEETASEFESDSIDFPVFNILILCMQVVDDIAYKLKFINILTQQRDNILKNIDSIHNLRLITTIFESDYEAYLKIYEAYKNNCILNSLERCDMIFTAAEKYTKEYDEDFFKYAFKDPRSNRFRRRFSYRFYDVDKNFYMPIFAQICDCKKILLSITTEDVLTLYKDLSYRNYKRKTSQMMNVIEKFRQLDDEIQEDIVKYILYSSFVIG